MQLPVDGPKKSRLLRRNEVLKRTGLSASTQWRLERAGRFPARVRISEHSVAWHESCVDDWIASREAVSGVEREAS